MKTLKKFHLSNTAARRFLVGPFPYAAVWGHRQQEQNQPWEDRSHEQCEDMGRSLYVMPALQKWELLKRVEVWPG